MLIELQLTVIIRAVSFNAFGLYFYRIFVTLLQLGSLVLGKEGHHTCDSQIGKILFQTVLCIP